MNIALFDIDGVLLNDEHRVQFALDKDWASYFDPAIMAKDTRIARGFEEVKVWDRPDWNIAYLTGRRSALRAVTERSLAENGFPFAPLYMREPTWLDENGKLLENGTWPKNLLAVFKVEEIRRIVSLYRPEAVVLFEDDPEVVRLVNESSFTSTVTALLVGWANKPKAMVKKAIA